MTYFDDTPVKDWDINAAIAQYLSGMDKQRAKGAMTKDLRAITTSINSTRGEKSKAHTFLKALKKHKFSSKKSQQQGRTGASSSTSARPAISSIAPESVGFGPSTDVKPPLKRVKRMMLFTGFRESEVNPQLTSQEEEEGEINWPEEDEEMEDQIHSSLEVWTYFKDLLKNKGTGEAKNKFDLLENQIIVIGQGVSPQKGVDDFQYQFLNRLLHKKRSLGATSNEIRDYIKRISSAETSEEMAMNIRRIPESGGKGFIFLQDIMLVALAYFEKEQEVRKKEKDYADSIFLPFMLGITRSLGPEYHYEHREANLSSMTELMLKRKMIKKRTEGYYADGIVRYVKDQILIIELCGHFGKSWMSEIQFDRLRATYGLSAMLETIADKYEYSSLSTFENLEVYLLHTKDHNTQCWSLRFINGLYIFQRKFRYAVDVDFGSKTALISNIRNMAEHIKELLMQTSTVLEILKKEHEAVILECGLEGVAVDRRLYDNDPITFN